jgi:hypothetical protein
MKLTELFKNKNQQIQNKYLSIISLIIIGIVSLMILTVFERTVFKNVILNQKENLLPSEFYSFYEAESHFVNHLRELNKDRYPEIYKNPINLMYTLVGSGREKILIQGDSWGEQFTVSEPSKVKLETYAKERDVTFIAAGISSYSPSLMTAQLNRLRSTYALHPSYVIGFIDQTDIGDELCRYQRQRAYGSKGLEVRPFGTKGTNEVYNTTDHLEKIKILESDNFNLIKGLIFAKKIVSDYVQNGREDTKCIWSDISKPLIEGVSSKDKEYLIRIFSEYIDTVFVDNKIELLLLVTFPHQKHISGEYLLDVRDLVIEAIKNSPHRSKILEFRPPIIGVPYKFNDDASHLTDLGHANYLVKPLLTKFDQLAQIKLVS